MTELLVLAPMRIERLALGERAGSSVIQTGMGPDRARIAAARALAHEAPALAVAGLCAGVDPTLRAGDALCATELVEDDGTRTPVPGSSLLVAALRRRGLRVHVGPLASTSRILGPADREGRAGSALAVDMESAWLAAGAAGRPLAVVRVVADEAGRSLADPRMAIDGPRALRSLHRVSGALSEWAAAVAPRTLLLAGPRSFCAGVDRAIDIVELALAQRGAPIYVRKQIVHNAHVVADLERRGAIFVEELDAVPHGATVVFSAHGVSPAVRSHAAARGLDVVRAVAQDADVVLVAGSETSSNSKRLVEVARREGTDAYLVDDETGVDVSWLAGAATVAITAGASAPERIVHRLVAALASLGPVDVEERTQTTESLRFRLPRELHV